MTFDNYECDGQMTITDYLASKLENRTVKDLTDWINSRGKSQYEQVEDVIRQTNLLESEEAIDKMTNKVSVFILNMSLEYMEYLRNENT